MPFLLLFFVVVILFAWRFLTFRLTCFPIVLFLITHIAYTNIIEIISALMQQVFSIEKYIYAFMFNFAIIL